MKQNKILIFVLTVSISVSLLLLFLILSKEFINDEVKNTNTNEFVKVQNEDKDTNSLANEDSEHTKIGSNIKVNETVLNFSKEDISKHFVSMDTIKTENADLILEDREETLSTEDLGELAITRLSLGPSGGCREFITYSDANENKTIEVNCYSNYIATNNRNTLIFEITNSLYYNFARKDINNTEVSLGIYDIKNETYSYSTLENYPHDISEMYFSKNGSLVYFYAGYKEGSLNTLDLSKNKLTTYESGTPYISTWALGAAYNEDTEFDIFSRSGKYISVPIQDISNNTAEVVVFSTDGEVIYLSKYFPCPATEYSISFSKCFKWESEASQENLYLIYNEINSDVKLLTSLLNDTSK